MDRWAVPVLLVLFALFFLALFLFPCSTISSYEMDAHMGECVRMCGHVFFAKQTSSGCFYTLFDGGEYRVVEFGAQDCASGYVCFYGRVSEWRGRNELIVLERG